jgi:hypothetical protein
MSYTAKRKADLVNRYWTTRYERGVKYFSSLSSRDMLDSNSQSGTKAAQQRTSKKRWPGFWTNSQSAHVSRFNVILIYLHRGEGLVVKNLESVYTLHGREDDWIKVKPEYMDSLGEEVDVLVMGGFWGSGRRGGTLSSFVCGVLDDSDPDQPKFLSFCKVGSGFSMEDFSKIT